MTTGSILNEHTVIGGDRDQAGDAMRPLRQQASGEALRFRRRHLRDDILIAGCRAGHRPAWDALLNRYQPYVFQYAWSLCHNRADAEDITAQALFRIYERLHTFREQCSFAAWITRITYNIYLDTLRRSRHKDILSLDSKTSYADRSPLESDIADPAPTPEAYCLDQAAVERIDRVFQHLPAHLRPTLQMYVQGYSYERVAEALGVSLGTVKSRISRARSTLRERLVSEPIIRARRSKPC